MGKESRKKQSMDLRPGGEVTFKYLFLEDYHPEYVSGIFGGKTPRNEIVLNFFFERAALPLEQTFQIKSDGRLGEENKNKAKPTDLSTSLVRQVKSGIIVSKEVAVELRDLLNELLETAPEEEGK